MGAVSYDTTNPNAVMEEETKRLNQNIESLIAVIENQNARATEDNSAIINALNLIYLSLQPNAFDINGELRDPK